MNLPPSFKSWALVGGVPVRMVVDVKDGEVSGVSVATSSGDSLVTPDDESAYGPMYAWASKALAWLKAEAGRASEVDFMLRSLESHHETALSFLKNLSSRKGELADVARAAYLARCGNLMGPLRAAYMADLVERCAEEMRRQADGVVSAMAFIEATEGDVP